MAELLGPQQDNIVKVRDHESGDFVHDGEVLKLKTKVILNSDATFSLVDDQGNPLYTSDGAHPVIAEGCDSSAERLGRHFEYGSTRVYHAKKPQVERINIGTTFALPDPTTMCEGDELILIGWGSAAASAVVDSAATITGSARGPYRENDTGNTRIVNGGHSVNRLRAAESFHYVIWNNTWYQTYAINNQRVANNYRENNDGTYTIFDGWSFTQGGVEIPESQIAGFDLPFDIQSPTTLKFSYIDVEPSTGAIGDTVTTMVPSHDVRIIPGLTTASQFAGYWLRTGTGTAPPASFHLQIEGAYRIS